MVDAATTITDCLIVGITHRVLEGVIALFVHSVVWILDVIS
jgi:hypothetical protein